MNERFVTVDWRVYTLSMRSGRLTKNRLRESTLSLSINGSIMALRPRENINIVETQSSEMASRRAPILHWPCSTAERKLRTVLSAVPETQGLAWHSEDTPRDTLVNRTRCREKRAVQHVVCRMKSPPGFLRVLLSFSLPLFCSLAVHHGGQTFAQFRVSRFTSDWHWPRLNAERVHHFRYTHLRLPSKGDSWNTPVPVASRGWIDVRWFDSLLRASNVQQGRNG